eukprot:gene35067-57954_t
MTEFHKSWRLASKARAMQIAQVKVLSDSKCAGPFYGAAFTLFGDPGYASSSTVIQKAVIRVRLHLAHSSRLKIAI